jgi:hypothetical protein
MRKLILFLTLSLYAFIFSCSSDDDTNSESNFEVNGTSWRGTGETNTARTITFTSASVYTYSEPGANIPGTYTYNSSSESGTLTDESGATPFFVNNTILTINYDTEGIETFVEQ